MRQLILGGGTSDAVANRLDLDYLKERQGNKYVDKADADKSLGTHKTNLDIASGSADSLTGLAGMAMSVKTLASKDASKWDKVGATGELIEGVVKTTAGVTKIVDSSIKSNNKENAGADLAGKVTGTIGDAFGAIKEAFFTVKDIYHFVSKVTSSEGIGAREAFKGSLSIITGMLKTAMGAVKTVRSILDVVGWGVSDALSTLIPGLSIAISGATITIKVYDSIVALVNRVRMKNIKDDFKIASKDRKAKIFGKRELNTSNKVKNFFTREKVDLAQVRLDEGKYKRIITDPTSTQEQKDTAQQELDMQKLKNFFAYEKVDLARNRDDKKAFKRIINNQASTEEQKKQAEQGLKALRLFEKTSTTKNNLDKTLIKNQRAHLEQHASSDAEKEELLQIREYELADEMAYINDKRTIRAGIHIGLEMVNIAGEIATLTGQGAVAGVPIKAAAAGTKVGMVGFRTAKQWGRDLTAKYGANNKIANKIFNTEKTSAKKHEKRVRDVNTIMDMIGALPALPSKTDAQYKKIKATYDRVENIILATGCEPKALYRLNGNIEKQRALLITAMKQRE